jgi:succinate dehydrogenase / fumarate reductase flavoprotein subunit
MGGLWVDYHLQSTIPGLFVLGEANFSDHGANRLGASALMQGLADGYFIVPYTLAHYIAGNRLQPVGTEHDAFREAEDAVRSRIASVLAPHGKRTVQDFHRELGRVLWDQVGMARSEASLQDALGKVGRLRDEFWRDVNVAGRSADLNKNLEFALRVADYLEFAEMMVVDALHRTESCGCHLREESQTEDGEAKRDDANFSYVAAWQFRGAGEPPALHKEPLRFESVEVKQRSYK